MKIYTYPKSRSLRVLWVLEEIGVTYEAIKVDLFNRGSNVKSPHPLGKVPFLIDEEETNSYIVRTMSRPAFVKAQEINNF